MGTNSPRPKKWGLATFVAVLGMSLAAAPSVAATASDLLQKAIYEEETVGNLDAAMKLYEQVIAEGKAGQEAAAQAQYRLALCYEKKGQDAEGKAAFEAVVANFPQQKELVAQAQKHLAKTLKLLPAPWTAGERQQLNMTLASGLPIGTMIYMVDASPVDGVDDAKHDGEEVTRCTTRGFVTMGDGARLSEVLCRTESFAPIESFWKLPPLGEARAVYGTDSATITMIGNDKTFTIDFTPPAFDNEQCAQLFRRLPLAVGYKTTLSVVTSIGGTAIEIPIEVTKIENIAVEAGAFECFRMELGIVNQTFWVSTDEHRYLVRFAAGGVSADLARVWQAEPGKGEIVNGDGFSVTLPEGWLSYSMSGSGDSVGENVMLLDPHAETRSEINVRPKSKLDADVQSSTEAWTEAYVKSIETRFVDFRVDDSGLVETKVAGHPATEITADFTDGDTKMRSLGVAVIGNRLAANLRFSCPAKDFDRQLPKFKEIVTSFKLK